VDEFRVAAPIENILKAFGLLTHGLGTIFLQPDSRLLAKLFKVAHGVTSLSGRITIDEPDRHTEQNASVKMRKASHQPTRNQDLNIQYVLVVFKYHSPQKGAQ
jgi:hypothetical protein